MIAGISRLGGVTGVDFFFSSLGDPWVVFCSLKDSILSLDASMQRLSPFFPLSSLFR